jgi:hypothetical protein
VYVSTLLSSVSLERSSKSRSKSSPLLSVKVYVLTSGYLFWFSTYGTKNLVSGYGVVGGGMPRQDQDEMTGCRYRPQTWITLEKDGEEYQECKLNSLVSLLSIFLSKGYRVVCHFALLRLFSVIRLLVTVGSVFCVLVSLG